MDKFTIEAVDLGQVFKIKIRHDNSMMHADWYLDQVEVVDEDSEEVFLFLCERWLSRKREDRLIERVFYVKVNKTKRTRGKNLQKTLESCCFLQGYDGMRESLNNNKNSALTVKSLDSNMNKKSKKKEEEDDVELPGKKS